MDNRIVQIKDVGTLTFTYGGIGYESGLRHVTELELNRNGEVYNLCSYLPPRWHIESGQRTKSGIRHYYWAISLREVDGLEAITEPLHELGHTRDFTRLYDEGCDVTVVESKVKIPTYDVLFQDITEYMRREYAAWEFAFGIISDLKLKKETTLSVNKISQEALQSHIDGIINLHQYRSEEFPSLLELAAKNSGGNSKKLESDLLKQHNKWLRTHHINT